MLPGVIGRMIQEAWMELPDRFPNMKLDAWVIMPNHFHGIVILEENFSERIPTRGIRMLGAGAPSVKLGDVIGAFKSITTFRYIQGVKQEKWPEIDRRLWNWNYYESIVCGEASLNRVRRYIELNPYNWERDRQNPFR